MAIKGGCHCGEIRYEIDGELMTGIICHCEDCRRSAGAPLMAWVMYAEDAMTLTKGTPKVYKSSDNGRRHFCGDCGTGLFYLNGVELPGRIDIQTASLDAPEDMAPVMHIQTAERIAWTTKLGDLPEFERFPPME